MPLPQTYPNSLFDILGSSYEIHALEAATNLASIQNGDKQQNDRDITFGLVVSDLTVIYFRSLLPPQIADEWFPIEDGVGGGFLAHNPLLRH